jgi:hypothetical protein
VSAPPGRFLYFRAHVATDDDTGGRLAPLSGLGHALLVFVGSAAIGGTTGAGRHSLDASTAEIAAYVADADVTRVWIGEYVAVLGYLVFLVFAPRVWAAVRGGTPDWPGRTATAAAAAYVVLSLAATACLAPVLNRGGDAAAALLDLRTSLFLLAFLAFGLWALTVGLRALGTRTLPRWLAWWALAVGALHLALAPLATQDPVFTGLPTFAGFLWIAVASVLLARRAGA